MATDSVLSSVKKTLGLQPEYTPFDDELVIHVNSVLGTLNQLGIGPVGGFEIQGDAETWSQFFATEDPRYNPVKSYVTLRVRMIFDPPAQQHLTNAFNEQIKELEWRLNTLREDDEWIDPTPPSPL